MQVLAYGARGAARQYGGVDDDEYGNCAAKAKTRHKPKAENASWMLAQPGPDRRPGNHQCEQNKDDQRQAEKPGDIIKKAA